MARAGFAAGCFDCPGGGGRSWYGTARQRTTENALRGHERVAYRGEALAPDCEGGLFLGRAPGFRAEVPDDWNGSLVVWAHGFRATGLELTVDNHPLRALLIPLGFAWAASSYSRNNYNITSAVQTTHALVKQIKANLSAVPGGWPNLLNVAGQNLKNLVDLFVPFHNEVEYVKRVDAHGKRDLLVQRAIRGVGHCDFTAAEFGGAFLDLVSWVETGVKPAGDDVLDPTEVANPLFGCNFTQGAHLLGVPCRDGGDGRDPEGGPRLRPVLRHI